MIKKSGALVFLVVAGLYIQTSSVSAEGDKFSLNPKFYMGVGAGFMRTTPVYQERPELLNLMRKTLRSRVTLASN